MVIYKKGDLFNTSAQVITNTVNCVGVMGKGIALKYKNLYPDMYKDYQAKCKNNQVKIGKPYLWENETIQILNFPTKKHWRNKSEISFIEEGLKYLANNYQNLGIHSLAIPPLGCGNGGLNWSNVKLLIDRYLNSLSDLEVFVYEYENKALDVIKNQNSTQAKEESTRKTAARTSLF